MKKENVTLYIYFSKFICRFDGRILLQKLRGKSVMFVGDSLSRNQWESLICMLYSSVIGTPYNQTISGDVSIFTFKVTLNNCAI